MSLAGRLRALERRTGTRGPCPVCEGRGRWGMVVVHSEDDPGDPKGCEHCGRLAGVKRIILEGVEREELPV